MYQRVERDGQARQFPEFHQRLGDLLVNVAAVAMENRADGGRLLSPLLEFYLGLVKQAATSGTAAEARGVLDNIARVLPRVERRAGESRAGGSSAVAGRARNEGGRQVKCENSSRWERLWRNR